MKNGYEARVVNQLSEKFDNEALDEIFVKLMTDFKNVIITLEENGALYTKLKEKFVELYRINVWETPESCAGYFEED